MIKEDMQVQTLAQIHAKSKCVQVSALESRQGV